MAKPHSHSPLPLSLLLLLLSLLLTPSLQRTQKLSPVDLRALIAIKNSLTDVPSRRGSPTAFFSTWDFSALDPCSTFSGLTCSSGRVTTLTLGTGLSDSPGLAGSLPTSIADLTELTQLILFPGIVTGPIPFQIGWLASLRVISLTNNRLTGRIPQSLSLLPNLHTLDLSYNSLAGPIPPGLTQLPNLKVLILASNSLSGEVPYNVSSQLLHLDFNRNGLTGPLPPSLPTTLRYVSLSENDMSGPISSVFDSLADLVHLNLGSNSFSGPLPQTLFRTTLQSLLLQRNNFSGWVPQAGSQPPSYGEGSIVDLSHNAITGELSPILAGVESLYLNNNRLIGTVPREYVKSVYVGTTRTLYLQHNYISRFPVEPGSRFPDTVSLCLSYNCMVPPVGLAACPASAGTELSRPASQCSVFNYG
ncbi:leucine-rich repeat receptor-like serine/threonine-protein kinase RGI4 [Pyrus x bretschneideri]|uniref:leucine-rich repeat receptor-like serine/threonine-protein kinase RGI4 n=1 Tax=Pyrus x bretschneideri TaxID=225117 RepID=UPI00202E3E62|nr:leucine-rich repeat receptor-like serine/threonine-protein kinase RGI4 [Pyrus x bretschneideri]